MSLRLLIFGAGAIGSLIGGFLKKAGFDVILIGREKHVRAINENGLRVISPLENFTIKIDAFTSVDEINEPSFDVIFITVKAYDTKTASQEINKIVNGDEYIVTLQNGLGLEDIIRAIIRDALLIRGVISHAAMLREPGVVEHTGLGDLIFGPVRAPSMGIIKEIAEKLEEETKMSAKIVNNIRSYVWLKLLINAAINPIGAITGLKNGQLLEHEELKTLMKNVIYEGLAVTRKLGITLPSDPLSKTFEVAQKTANNKCSMLQDIEKRRKTEIDYINGAIVYQAILNNLAAPVNDTLTKLIKGFEATYLKTY
ncbi:MAG: ketopantoate reductase family protein [Candidatus Asgardarchaeum sp.]